MQDDYFAIPGTDRKGKPKGGDKAFVQELELMWKDWLESRRQYEENLVEALSFTAGDQWTDIESTMVRRYNRRPRRPRYCESRVTDNQIMTYARQTASSVSRAIPDYEAIQSTNDPEDISAAALGTRIIKWRDSADREHDKRELEFLWLLHAGEVIRETYYDPYALTKDKVMGDIVTETLDFFSYVKDPTSNWQWPPKGLIKFGAHHVDWIEDEYGVKVTSEECDESLSIVRDLTMNVMQGEALGSGIKADKDSAIVKSLYCPPSNKYPEGKCFVWCRGQLLDEHELQAGIWPFVRIPWFLVPLRLYPISFIDPLIPDQKRLNELLSQTMELRVRQMRQDVITDATGEAQQKIINSKTGQKIIMMPPGAKHWEFLRYEFPVQMVQQEFEGIFRNLHEKSGVSEPQLGQPMTTQQTATMMQMVREASFEKIDYHMGWVERGYRDVNAIKLALVKEYFSSSRLIRNTGSNSAEDTDSFYGAELRDTTDVRAVPNPHLTPAMERQQRSEMIGKGILAGPWTGSKGGYDPAVELAARSALKAVGLYEDEENIARAGMPFEELKQIVFELNRIDAKAIILKKLLEYGQLEQAASRMGLDVPDEMAGLDLPQPGGPMMGPGGPGPEGMGTGGPPPPEMGPGGPPPEMQPGDVGMDTGGAPYVPMAAGETPTDLVLA